MLGTVWMAVSSIYGVYKPTPGCQIKSTQQFTYLGCIIYSYARINKEIDNRLSKANSSFGGLFEHV